jgi:hypothetical protein
MEFGSLSESRRHFLRLATGAALLRAGPALSQPVLSGRKVVVVTFGGGARDEETFMPDGQENIPRLINELLPRATFFSQVINRGILGHYVATASLATGTYESFNNFADVRPSNPTVFEYYRRDRKRPATDTWVIAPSNGFRRIGESGHRLYGNGSGAGVILPKRLLAAALGSSSTDADKRLLVDNYETPLYAPALAGDLDQLNRLASILKLSMADFKAHARTVASPDELSVFLAQRLMRELSPSLLWITLHDIDIAHSGAYSLYIDGIRSTDRLCAELWKTIEKDPEYSGRTNLFILPDFGRDGDTDSGGNGFQHHRTGDTLSRTTWMIAMGRGFRENVVVDRPIESIDLVPTLGALLGFQPALARGERITELVTA